MADPLLSSIGVALILVGFAVAFVAMIWLILSSSKNGEGKVRVRGGGAVIIGPVPIIFGTDKESVKILLVLSIVLVALLIVWMLVSQGIFR